MKKYLLIASLMTLIVPSVAFASWWNPFSWFHFSNSETIEVATSTVQAMATTTSTSTPKTTNIIPRADEKKKAEQVTVPIPTQTTTTIASTTCPTGMVCTPITQVMTKPVDLYAKYRDPATGEIMTPVEWSNYVASKLTSKEINPVTGKIYTLEDFGLVGNSSSKTPDQKCADKYGANSIWTGTKTDSGAVNCKCASGYVPNGAGTACQIQQQSSYNNYDPYNVEGPGTAYSPDELNAIDCAYYGRNCPTINVRILNH